MKKNLTFFLGLLATGALLTSCGSEKLAVSGHYSTLAIAQKSPSPAHVEQLPPAPLKRENKTAPVFSASLERQPGITIKTSSPNIIKTHAQPNTVSQVSLDKHEKVTHSNRHPKHNLKTAAITSGKESPSGNRNWLAALLLAIFLGELGIHRFYLGYITIGTIQLLMTLVGTVLSFFLIGIPILIAVFIWVLVDIIRIAMGDLKPKNGEYDFLWFETETPAPKNNSNEI